MADMTIRNHRTRKVAAPGHRPRPPGNPRKSIRLLDFGNDEPQTSQTQDDALSDDPIIRVKGLTMQQVPDPFNNVILHDGAQITSIIEPPFNPHALLRMPTENHMLRQCIDSMVTNTEGHGWRLEYIGPPDQQESDPAKLEKAKLEAFLSAPNPEHSVTETRERFRRDLETVGDGYYEMGRNADGTAAFVHHVPAHTVRLTQRDATETEFVTWRLVEGAWTEVKAKRRFRRYVQVVGSKRVYFKEFGDPRVIDPSTGQEKPELGADKGATEIIHGQLYTPGTPYGSPRWINQLPAIMGSRQAELTNLDYFRDNAVPAMIITVAGGEITQASLDEIEQHLSSVRGRSSFNRVAVIEAVGHEEAASNDGTVSPPTLEVKPLRSEQANDGRFLEYDKECAKKVRAAFRLPPIFVGQSEDYSHATAKSAYAVAESQVFGPERTRSDELWNAKVLATFQPVYWALRANPPRITDPQDVLSAVDSFDRAGALTPNVVIGLANEYFDLRIPTILHEWGNWPFSLVGKIADKGTLVGLEAIIDPVREEAANAMASLAAQARVSGPADAKPSDEAGDGEADDEPPEGATEDEKKAHRQRVAAKTLRKAMVGLYSLARAAKAANLPTAAEQEEIEAQHLTVNA